MPAMTTSPRTLNSVIFNAFFIVCLICFVFCLTLQKYKKLRKSPNIWDILHHYVMSNIFTTVLLQLPPGTLLIPNVGTIYSQCGNVMFPAWEYHSFLIPTTGCQFTQGKIVVVKISRGLVEDR
jgi:hypothetical protein